VLQKFYKNLNISQKLTISYFFIGVFSLVIVSVIYYLAFREALLERTFAQLSSINILKKIQVEDYIKLKKITDSNFNKENINQFEYILLERTGMGETGESYLVNKDFKMLTQSRFIQNNINPDVKTKAVIDALKGKEGYGIIEDYRGVKVISYYRKIASPNLEWVIISEIDFNEAIKPAEKVKNYIIGIVVIFTLLIVYITIVLSGKLANPIKELKLIIEELSQGKIPESVVNYDDKDEIGDMVVAINNLTVGIKRTSEFAFETGLGNFNAVHEPLSEHDVLGNTLIQMRDKIVELQQKQLLLARQRSAAIVEGQEKERQRMARELHDGLGQLLTGIRYKIEALKIESIAKEEVKNLLDETIAEVRRISHNAMPSALIDFGLESALRAMCKKNAAVGNIQIEFDFVINKNNLPFDITTTLYRIAQEALNNILKHSNSTKALMEVYQENNNIIMEISDNGIGFDRLNNNYEGNGLRNMEERAKLCGGTAVIISEPGKGTKKRIVIPLH